MILSFCFDLHNLLQTLLSNRHSSWLCVSIVLQLSKTFHGSCAITVLYICSFDFVVLITILKACRMNRSTCFFIVIDVWFDRWTFFCFSRVFRRISACLIWISLFPCVSACYTISSFLMFTCRHTLTRASPRISTVITSRFGNVLHAYDFDFDFK